MIGHKNESVEEKRERIKWFHKKNRNVLAWNLLPVVVCIFKAHNLKFNMLPGAWLAIFVLRLIYLLVK